jgi:ferredoxin
MQTNFSASQLSDPDVAASEAILRKCVHCGFCTATCPTYLLLGDELDSPRGRIYLIKEMLENDRPADAKTVKHIDRCLSSTTPAPISKRRMSVPSPIAPCAISSPSSCPDHGCSAWHYSAPGSRSRSPACFPAASRD